MLNWINAARAYLESAGLLGWLVHDFRGSNAVLARLLPASGGKRWTTRRVDLWVPAKGPLVLLAAPLDAGQFADAGKAGVEVRTYNGHEQYRAALVSLLGAADGGANRGVAMEYAPMGALPIVGVVDAGTIELVRSLGVEVVSSADVMQACVARWSEAAVAEHARSSAAVGGIMREAFAEIGRRLKAGASVFEHEIAEFVRGRFAQEKLEYPDGPIVAVNAHAGDPHYEPGPAHPTPIRPGDWVLIDMWARRGGEEHIYSDITWTGFVALGGKTMSDRHREVFDVVRRARDAALAAAQQGWKAGRGVQGWELDEAARGVIISAGYARGIKHRTGHSLSAGAMVHGLGMNLDNLETHDTRAMLPGIGFTIEPGVYLPEELGFGVRNEINVYVDPAKGPVVTSVIQDEPVMIA
jgi:Xaa-Pro aminopeptidase